MLQLRPRRALRTTKLILEMDILMTKCLKEDCNVRLELKERCLANRDGCYMSTDTPLRLIDLVVFAEHPHCHLGSFRGVQERPSRSIEDSASAWMSWKGLAEVVPRFPTLFVGWMCSLVSW